MTQLFSFQRYPKTGTRTDRGTPRVGGTVMGDFFKDDKGGLWRYETQAGYPFGQVRGVTDQYGGRTTHWRDRGVFDDHPDIVNQEMDTIAAAWVGPISETPVDTTPASDTTPSDITPSDTTPAPGDGTTPKPKPGAPKSAPKTIVPSSGPQPAASSSWFSKPVVILAIVAIPVALWMWKAA